jgi:hypothetical protein
MRDSTRVDPTTNEAPKYIECFWSEHCDSLDAFLTFVATKHEVTNWDQLGEWIDTDMKFVNHMRNLRMRSVQSFIREWSGFFECVLHTCLRRARATTAWKDKDVL